MRTLIIIGILIAWLWLLFKLRASIIKHGDAQIDIDVTLFRKKR